MKRKTAREILAESFRELAAGKSIDKITIREIAENCGYSPATFYRNFHDKYDLIVWDYTRGVAAIMDRIDGRDYLWSQTLLDGMRQFHSGREYLANLFLHTSGHDSFIRYMTDINCRALEKHLLSVSGQAALDEKTAMYVRLYCLGTVSLTCEWILGRYSATPEDLARVFENSLPTPLRVYLLPE